MPLTVGAGDDDAVLPETDGSIRAGDYLFDADVTGAGTITFTNSSDNQFHHVILVDFGTNDPAVVEENLPDAARERRGCSACPRASTPAQINFEFAILPGVRPWRKRHVRGAVRGRAHVRRPVLHPGP